MGDGFGTENDPTLQNNRTEETTNYEISRTVRNTVRESGEVTRLSVAVLVDGRYTTNEAGEKIYEPRSQEELDKIATLVRSTVGFDENRGDTIEVVNMPFTDVDTAFDIEDDLLFGFERSEVLNFGEMIMLVVMGLLVVLLVLRPLVSSIVMSQKAAIDQAREEAALLAAADAPVALAGPSAYERKGDDAGGNEGFSITGDEDDNDMIDMQAVEGKVKASSVKKVGNIVSSHPTETVSVIRNWMAQE